MYESLFIIGIICAVFAGGFLIATVVMFFGFNIPALRKDVSGSLEQKQIEEIRKNSASATGKHRGANVFEELEKKAKVKKGNTSSLNIATTTAKAKKPKESFGTSLLRRDSKPANPDFVIEKNIMFVSTDTVI